MTSKKPKTLQPDLFDLKNPPVAAPLQNCGFTGKEPAPLPLPQAATPEQVLPLEERETSPNSDPASLTQAHPYKGPGVKDGASMAPSRWRKR